MGESVEQPAKYFRNNVANTITLLDAMLQAGVGRIVFSSTAAVYGEPDTCPIEEDHPQRPVNPYGRTKLQVEEMLSEYSAAYDLGAVALRYFNAAGADPAGDIGEDHEPEAHLIPIVLQVALGQREKVYIFGDDYETRDGTCVRDYVHVIDLAQAHILALRALDQGSRTYNLGNGNGFTVREVIEVAREITGHPIPAEVTDRRPGDPATLIASSDKIHRELGWTPQYSDLRDIIQSAWDWHVNHPEGYK